MPKITLTEKDYEKIEELIELFDFEKAHALFHTMGWTYLHTNETPTVEILKENARDRLYSAIECGSSESGRFKATYMEGNNELTLQLIFDENSIYIGE